MLCCRDGLRRQAGQAAEKGREAGGAAQRESARDIGSLGLTVQMRLAAGAASAAQQALRACRAQHPRHLPGNHRRLVVAALPASHPVQRHGDHQIHVRVERRGGQALAQQACGPAPRPEIAMVLERLGDLSVPGFHPIMIKSRSIRIRLIFINLNLRVETIGHRVVVERGIAGLRQVGEALQAEMPLLRNEGTAAHHAHSRQDEVQQGREGSFQA